VVSVSLALRTCGPDVVTAWFLPRVVAPDRRAPAGRGATPERWNIQTSATSVLSLADMDRHARAERAEDKISRLSGKAWTWWRSGVPAHLCWPTWSRTT
jgi:hypothetical protein